MRQIIQTNEYYSRVLITRNRIAAGTLIFTQICLILAYGLVVRPSAPPPSQDNSNEQGMIGTTCLALLTLLGVVLNIVPGPYRLWSTIGFCLLITALSLQVHPLCVAFWETVKSNYHSPLSWGKTLSFYLSNHSVLSTSTLSNTLMNSFKCALSLVVVFSTICGRAGLIQTVIIGTAGPFFYQLNAQLVATHAMDFGGTITVFCFGGVMGTTASAIYNHCQHHSTTQSHPLRPSNSFLFTLKGVGSLLCWVLVPFLSFDFPDQLVYSWSAILNSLVGISSTVLGVVALDSIRMGQLDYLTLSMSPLAGGVALASSAPLMYNAAEALVFGLIVALALVVALNLPLTIHTVLYTDNRNGLFFGFSGIIGGLLSSIILQFSQSKQQYQLSFYGVYSSATANALYSLASTSGQIVGTLISIGIGAGIGVAFGFALLWIGAEGRQDHYHDQTYWLTKTDSISPQVDRNELNSSEEWHEQSKPQTENFKELILKEPYYIVSKHSFL